MSKIRLHGSSSGYTEIAPVAASGNNTLTLPNDGTIISKDSNGVIGVTSITVGTGVTIGDGRLTASSGIVGLTSTGLPAGSIIQAKSTTKTDVFTTTSGTFTDVTGLSVDITPTNSSNKILVRVFVCGSGRSGYARCVPRLVRDSTAIGNNSAPGSRIAGFAQLFPSGDTSAVHSAGIEFLDSPGDTSSHTYKVQIVNGNNSSDVMCINRSYDDGNNSSSHRYSSSISVMELAA